MDDTPRMAQRVFTIPNLLSLFRLLLIPLMLDCYLRRHEPLWTIALLGVSALTDVIDGRIARKFHMVSNLGKILDPIADKLTQLAMMSCLIFLHPELIAVLALQVIREVCMGIVGLVVMKKTKFVNSAVWHGKACTVILYASLLLLFLLPDMATWLVWLLAGICMVAILTSFILYMEHYRSLLHQHKGQDASRRKNCAS